MAKDDVTVRTKEKVIGYLSRKRGITLEEARALFEPSETCRLLMDKRSRFWEEAYDYIAEKFSYEEQGDWEKWRC